MCGDYTTRDDGTYGGGEPCPSCSAIMHRDDSGQYVCPDCDTDLDHDDGEDERQTR